MTVTYRSQGLYCSIHHENISIYTYMFIDIDIYHKKYTEDKKKIIGYF